MSENTQGTGGAGSGSGSGSTSGAGTGTGGGGASTGPGRTRLVALAAALLAIVAGVALLTAPLVDRWSDPNTRMAFYPLALLAVYAACTSVVANVGRRNT